MKASSNFWKVISWTKTKKCINWNKDQSQNRGFSEKQIFESFPFRKLDSLPSSAHKTNPKVGGVGSNETCEEGRKARKKNREAKLNRKNGQKDGIELWKNIPFFHIYFQIHRIQRYENRTEAGWLSMCRLEVLK